MNICFGYGGLKFMLILINLRVLKVAISDFWLVVSELLHISYIMNY